MEGGGRVGVEAPLAHLLDRELHDLVGDRSRVGRHEAEAEPHRSFGVETADPGLEHERPETRCVVEGEPGEDRRVRQRAPRPWERGVREHEPCDLLGLDRGLQDADDATHRVAHEHDPAARLLVDEAGEDAALVHETRPPAVARRVPEPRQVGGDDPPQARETPRHLHPIDVGATEPVHEHERGVVRPVPSPKGDRTVEVGGPQIGEIEGHGPRLPAARPCAGGRREGFGPALGWNVYLSRGEGSMDEPHDGRCCRPWPIS
jgi:hypothetical protein